MPVQEAAQAALDKAGKARWHRRSDRDRQEGNFAMPFNTSGMYRGKVGEDGKVSVEIYR